MASEVTTPASPSKANPEPTETRFVNAMRLSSPQWMAVAGVLLVTLLATPPLWKKMERFGTGPNYRIPYPLSRDYWLYEQRLQRVAETNIVMIGDSVVWGEYVRPEGTLTHFLNDQCGQPGKFVNAGVNGMFPLALEGLIRSYGKPLQHRKVILHCNVLWMTSPKADLSTDKEERFNHADLVPQFTPRIPCYKADLNHRLAAIVERNFTFSEWANHLQIAYFGEKNLLNWTLEEEDANPPRYPNAYKNPFKQITMTVPTEPSVDSERGPASSRHKPWSTSGQGSTRFEWVDLDRSLQWAAFRRLVDLLKARGNDVLVVLGPFNEHILADENRPAFRRIRDEIAAWLTEHQISNALPDTLPSLLYADASHPLTEGYELLAERLGSDTHFRQWCDRR